MTKQINKNAVLQYFYSYLEGGLNIQDAIEEMIQGRVNEDMTDGETIYVVEQVLIPEIILLFAEKYDSMTNCYDYDSDEADLNAIFENFCTFEGLSESNLQNTLAMAINEAAAADGDDDDDDNEVVFKPGTRRPYKASDWTELSDEERQERVKKFLRKLANVHLDAKEMRPFLKNLDVGPNPFDIDVDSQVKVFDRKANRFGHPNNLGNWVGPNESTIAEGTIAFPNNLGQGHDEDHNTHPLHKTCCKFGYDYFKITPVTQKDGSILHHHTWTKGPHQIGAYHNDVNWSSKVSPSSGHVYRGSGTLELEKHLLSKAKKYKNQNESVAHVSILENLLDPASHDRVAKYAEFMKRNPATAFGVVGGSYKVDSPAQQLIEAAKLKTKADKRFNQGGKDPSEWSIFDYRSGKPK